MAMQPWSPLHLIVKADGASPPMQAYICTNVPCVAQMYACMGSEGPAAFTTRCKGLQGCMSGT